MPQTLMVNGRAATVDVDAIYGGQDEGSAWCMIAGVMFRVEFITLKDCI
jgi:hypothetical protein